MHLMANHAYALCAGASAGLSPDAIGASISVLTGTYGTYGYSTRPCSLVSAIDARLCLYHVSQSDTEIDGYKVLCSIHFMSTIDAST